MIAFAPIFSLLLFAINGVNKFKLCLYALTTFILANYYLGFFTYLLQRNYQRSFTWPLNVRYPLLPYAPTIKEQWPPPQFLLVPSASFLAAPLTEPQALDLLVMIKSSRSHYYRRSGIRRTWGASSLSLSGRRVKHVFIVAKAEAERSMTRSDMLKAYRAHGYPLDSRSDPLVRSVRSERLEQPETDNNYREDGIDDDLDPFYDPELGRELSLHDDLVVGNFVDHYYNNTLKSLLALRYFATSRYSTSKHVLLVDDDYYLDHRALFAYIDAYTSNVTGNSITTLSPAVIHPRGTNVSQSNGSVSFCDDRGKDIDLNLYAGYVFPNSVPHRLRSSKWFVDLASYPFDSYPPYVTGGAILLSSDVARKFYELAPYTKPFVFDDVYLSILALKLRIKPIHNPDFVLFPPRNYKVYLKGKIASHGFDDTDYLIKVWTDLNSHHVKNATITKFPPTLTLYPLSS